MSSVLHVSTREGTVCEAVVLNQHGPRTGSYIFLLEEADGAESRLSLWGAKVANQRCTAQV
jgi:hypothetical protein